MARITVEDCLDHVDNRFELVLVGSKRARQLMVGNKEPHVEWENDKATVVALREIEQGLVTAKILDEVEQEDYFEDDFASSFDRQNAELAALMGEVSIDSPAIIPEPAPVPPSPTEPEG
ncbi:UNVERIFIED_CONTAM: hypothetical protein GTU68_014821 [Idotea baltica]|nr:hypothetical protein [Idotea baltica]